MYAALFRRSTPLFLGAIWNFETAFLYIYCKPVSVTTFLTLKSMHFMNFGGYD